MLKRNLGAAAVVLYTCYALYSNRQTCTDVNCPYGFESRETPHVACRGLNCHSRNPGDILACCEPDVEGHSTRSCFDVGFPWFRSLMWTSLYVACTIIMMETKNLDYRAVFYALVVLAPSALEAFGFKKLDDPFMDFKWYAISFSLCCHYLICRKVIPPWVIYYLWSINIAGLNYFELQHVSNAPWVLLNTFSNLANNFIITSHYYRFGNKGYAIVKDTNNMYFEQCHHSHYLTWAWNVNYWFVVCAFMTAHESFGWKQYECFFGAIPLGYLYGVEHMAMYRPFMLGFWMVHGMFFMDFDSECTWGFTSNQFQDFSQTHSHHKYWSMLLSVGSFASAIWLLNVYHKCTRPFEKIEAQD